MSDDVQKLITQTLDQRADQAPDVSGGDLMGSVVGRARATQRRRRIQMGAVAVALVLVLIVTIPGWRGSATTPAGPATPTTSAEPPTSSEPSSVSLTPTPTVAPTESAAQSPSQSAAAPPSGQTGYNAVLALPEGDPVKLTPRAEMLTSGRTRIVLPGGTSANGVVLPAETALAVHPRPVVGGGVAVLGDTPSGGPFPNANLYLVNGAKARVVLAGQSRAMFVDPQGRTGLVLGPARPNDRTMTVATQVDLTTGAVIDTWPEIGPEAIAYLGWTQAGLWVLGPDGASIIPRQGRSISLPTEVYRVARVIEGGVTRVQVLTQNDRQLCQVSFDDGTTIPDLAATQPDFCVTTRHPQVHVRAYQPQPDGSVLLVFDDQDRLANYTPQARRAVVVARSGSVAELPVPAVITDVDMTLVGNTMGMDDVLDAGEPDGCTLWQIGSPDSDDNAVVRWCLNGNVERAPLADDVQALA